jgi:sodium/proline symporter
LVAYLLALRGGSVLNIVAYAWAGFGAAFGPVVILSLYWNRMTSAGALAGMVSGAVTVLAWETWGSDAVYSIIPGVLISTACVLAFSRLGRVPTGRDWSRLDNDMSGLAATPPPARS